MAFDLSFLQRESAGILHDFLVRHLFNVLFMGAVIIVAMLAIRFIDTIYLSLKKRLGERYGFPVSLAAIKFAIYLVSALLIIISIPGISGGFVQLLAVAAGIVIAFSSSTLIANGMAGIMIKITKPYDVGDVMSVKGHFGKVYHIGLLHTEIQTPHREIVNVPNLIAVSDMVVNYSVGDYLVNVRVNLGYDISHSFAEKLLLEAVERTKLKQGFVLVKDLGSFGVDYEINGLLGHEEKIPRKESELRKNIFNVFYENNVQIMTPYYMAMRQLYHDETVLPGEHKKGPRRGVRKPEKVMFEKAELFIEKQKAKDNRDAPSS